MGRSPREKTALSFYDVMRPRWPGVMIIGCILTMAAPVAGQDARAWTERAFVTIELPFQTLNDDFAESSTFPDTIRKTESAHFSAGYASTRGPLFDVGAGFRVWRRFGLGATVSYSKKTSSGSFDLTVPSLIAGNNPLDLTGSVPGLVRRDVGVHIQALYPIDLGKQTRVMLSGGPTLFSTRQDLVKSVAFDTLSGLTTLKLDQVFVTETSKSVVGFNIGADITWDVARHLGVATVTRYSHANVTLDPGSVPGISRSVSFNAGGLQVGGGVRVRF
jgi:hypothetical protein